jgi:hypothetical protein
MIVTGNNIKYRVPKHHLHLTYLKRRCVVKEPPKAIRFNNCEEDINFIRNSIFISVYSQRTQETKLPEFRFRSRPLTVERVGTTAITKNIRVSSQPGSRLRPIRENAQETIRLNSEEDVWDNYKALCTSVCGLTLDSTHN